jgi:hypothetical protein
MTQKPKRGRPPVESGHAKSESLLLRLSSAEKQGFAEAAAMAGAPLTVWMRERLRRAAAKELEDAARSVPFLAPPEKSQLPQKDQRMRLSTELVAYGISESSDSFRERLVEKLLRAFPGRSIDSVVCNPIEASRYCEMIRAECESNPPDVVILKSLMNIRRKKSCPTGLKSLNGKKRLKSKLSEIGYESGEDEFRDLVSDCLADMYKSQTIDEVLCHPHEAAALCNYIRSRGESDELTDELILTTLLNNRKSV